MIRCPNCGNKMVKLTRINLLKKQDKTKDLFKNYVACKGCAATGNVIHDVTITHIPKLE